MAEIAYFDEATWRRACEAGETTVREALAVKKARRQQRGAPAYDELALLTGALTEIARELRVIAQTHRLGSLEDYALAYVRGEFREADVPLEADGTPFISGQSLADP
jgi:hypothetical protein